MKFGEAYAALEEALRQNKRYASLKLPPPRPEPKNIPPWKLSNRFAGRRWRAFLGGHTRI